MKEFLILTGAVFTANVLSHYFMGLMFCFFKANKYEDVLAKKIASEVNNEKI